MGPPQLPVGPPRGATAVPGHNTCGWPLPAQFMNRLFAIKARGTSLTQEMRAGTATVSMRRRRWG